MLKHAIAVLEHEMEFQIGQANEWRAQLEAGLPVNKIPKILANYQQVNAIIDEMREELRQLKNATTERERNNCGVKEIRTMTAEELRYLCINNNWYTGGTNEEYANLLSMVGKPWEPVNLTTEKLAVIAEDILTHSDIPADYGITCVMFELAKAATVCFDFE